MMRCGAIFIFSLLQALDAFARAGGGGGYHGGGHSGGSFHSSGGSGGGDISGLVIYLLFRHPILVLMIVALYFYLNRQRVERKEAAIDTTSSNGLDFEADARRQEALQAIVSRDPQFNEAAFLQRVGAAFLVIQDAWSRSEMARARAFISDGVHERFSRQLDDLRARGLRNSVENVSVLETSVLGYQSGRHFDSAYVAFRARALDRTVSLEGGAVLSSDESEFAEVWTFLRRPGAKTLARPGALEGHCPSCGAPLAIIDAAQCSSCKAWVNSAEHDWVLTAITQTSEWAFPSPEREVAGWEDLRKSDADLSLEALEDRAAVAFWRWLDARRRRDVAPLRGISTESFSSSLKFDEFFERDAAVGLVQTVAFEPGADFDRAHIQVRWEADTMQGAMESASFVSRERRTHNLLFRRKCGAASDLKAGLSTSRCPSCGAAPEQPDTASCAYCGHAFNDGAISWVLCDIAPSSQ